MRAVGLGAVVAVVVVAALAVYSLQLAFHIHFFNIASVMLFRIVLTCCADVWRVG